MISYHLDEIRQDKAAEAICDLSTEGYTDGSNGHTLNLKHRHSITYMEQYSLGIKAWLLELKRREQEAFDVSMLEF
jgi:hypothetical protein